SATSGAVADTVSRGSTSPALGVDGGLGSGNNSGLLPSVGGESGSNGLGGPGGGLGSRHNGGLLPPVGGESGSGFGGGPAPGGGAREGRRGIPGGAAHQVLSKERTAGSSLVSEPRFTRSGPFANSVKNSENGNTGGPVQSAESSLHSPSETALAELAGALAG